MATITDALDVINKLSETDKEFIRAYLEKAIMPKTDTLEGFTEENRFSNGRVCVHCGCTHIVRNGHTKQGKQRYLCKGCGATFVITTNAITHSTKKDLEVWKKYIDCMINKFTIRKSAM